MIFYSRCPSLSSRMLWQSASSRRVVTVGGGSTTETWKNISSLADGAVHRIRIYKHMSTLIFNCLRCQKNIKNTACGGDVFIKASSCCTCSFYNYCVLVPRRMPFFLFTPSQVSSGTTAEATTTCFEWSGAWICVSVLCSCFWRHQKYFAVRLGCWT